ncbi:MAG: magnesium and cobalt transport protein CorA [Salinivirgaceae bacterium]|nr:MAG: magnesium and cobalt transport protein CorA [Salinivirgaceae bacterium]
MARFLKNREKTRGQSPGSLIFQGEKKQERVKITLRTYNETTLNEQEISIDDLNGEFVPGTIKWINVDGLHDINVIKKIGEIFNVSTLALEDILNTDQRPRYFEDEHQLIVIMKALLLNKETELVEAEQVSFVVGKDYLISFQEKSTMIFDDLLYRLRNGRGRIRKSGTDYLAYALMDTLVDSYILNIEAYGRIIEDYEKELLHPTQKLSEAIFKHKTEIAFFRKNIRPLKEVTNRFQKSESGLIKKATRQHYIPDLDDLVTQALDAVEIYYTMVADQLNIYNTNVTNRANDVMKVLTIFAAIFIPLTFIAGVYGTNFKYVPELGYKYGYFGMWGVMILVAGVMLIYFKRKGWL